MENSQFWKIFLLLYFIFFFLTLFWIYGFPPDFKMWKFDFSSFLIVAFFYTLPLAIIFTFFIKWIIEKINKKRKGEIVISKGDIWSLLSFSSGILTIFLVFFLEFLIGAFIFSIIAIICGIIGFKRSENKSLSIIGLTLGTLLLILLLLSIPSPSLRKNAREARIFSDMRQIGFVAGDYYNKNYSYRGLEKDSNLIILKEDILKMGGINFAINISPDEKEYCSEVITPSKKWYCVDSNNTEKYYTVNPKCSNSYFLCE
jgi:hypothetical protein